MTFRAQSTSARHARVIDAPFRPAVEFYDVMRFGSDRSSGACQDYPQPGLSPAQKLVWIVGLAAAAWIAVVTPIALIV